MIQEKWKKALTLTWVTSSLADRAVVINDVGNNVTVAGVPAKVIKQGAMLG